MAQESIDQAGTEGKGSSATREQRGLDFADFEEAFWQNVQSRMGCWIWTGSRQNMGYGRFCKNGHDVLAHRLSWELHNGPIPDGMHVLHHCDNPPCVRPDHLFIGTHADNMRDMATKGRTGSWYATSKTHCPQGHEYTSENTYFYPNGSRSCKICRHEWSVRDALAQKEVRRQAGKRLWMSPDQAAAIRAEYQQGGVTKTELAKKYNVHRTTVADIVTGKSWGRI